jgi:septum formation protein
MLSRPLILASASPRRAELLTQIGLDFRVCPAHADEPPPSPGEDVVDWARQIAEAKARATAALLPADPVLVLGADTVVLITGGEDVAAPCYRGKPASVLGKPRDAADARAMLRRLSGRKHVVLSAFAVLAHPEDTLVTCAVATTVRFRHLDDAEIDAYIAMGEPLDKAGAYGIQGRGAVLIHDIDGDYYTVVGLPLAELWSTLAPWRG